MYKPNKIKIPKDRSEWLSFRMTGIGGSDAGAVLGMNPYKSRFTLWAEKTGRIRREVSDNLAMEIGRAMEDFVARKFAAETGLPMRKSTYMFQHPDYPWMIANVDRITPDHTKVLECKTTSELNKSKYDKGDIPIQYYCQCVHYLAVTGAKKAYIAVLIGNKDFKWWEIERDEEEIQRLIEAEKDFWLNNVLGGRRIDVDESASTEDTLERMYPTDTGEDLELGSSFDEDLDRLEEIKQITRELETEGRLLKNRLRNVMKDSKYAYSTHFKIRNNLVTRTYIDDKKLKSKYPEVYRDCSYESSYRTLVPARLKEGNNADN